MNDTSDLLRSITASDERWSLVWIAASRSSGDPTFAGKQGWFRYRDLRTDRPTLVAHPKLPVANGALVEAEWVDGNATHRLFEGHSDFATVTEHAAPVAGSIPVLKLVRRIGVRNAEPIRWADHAIYYGFADEEAARSGALSPIAERFLGFANGQG